MSNEEDPYKDYISKSRLSLFKYCPKKYYHSYVLGEKDEANFAMATGTRFHEWAEKVLASGKKYPLNQWDQFIRPSYSPYEQQMMKWFIDVERKRYSKCNGDLWTPYSVEDIYYNHDWKIRGIIDRIDYIHPAMLSYITKDVGKTLTERTFNKIVDNVLSKKPQLIICEYKTGKKSMSEAFFCDSIKEELTFYKFILTKLDEFKKYEIPCGCLINPNSKEVVYVDFKRESTIEKRILALKNSTEFPPKCTDIKYLLCNKCKTPFEAGLFKVHEDVIKKEIEEGLVLDSWEYNLYI